MTQIVIDIPNSLATLLPTWSTEPHVTDPVWFDIASTSLFIAVAIGVAALVAHLAIGIVRALQRVETPRPRAKSQSLINWLRYGGVNGVQR